LYNGPFLASVAMAANALLASGDDNACADLLPRIATGETVATLAVTERDGRWHAGQDEQTTAEAAGARGWVLRGVKTFVVDGMTADVILVTARTDRGTSMFAVDAAAAGVTRRSLTTLDLTRSLAELTFADVPARLVGAPGSAAPVIDTVLDRLLVAVAAESVGGMRACLDMCVGYAKTRKQFGVPIGSFQAVAHKCVDMLQRAEFGGAAVQYAAAAQAQESDDFALAAKVAAAYCGPAYHWVTAETIQIHGGLGFTWEHDAHLYYRRSRSSEQLFGSAGEHFDGVAARAGL
jgi:alkylation response protein AidB-like acyl-CoA dehydrogenase